MTGSGGPRFTPSATDDLPPRVRRLEDWAGRHDEWSHHQARGLVEEQEGHGKRLDALEGKMTRVLASIGEHRMKWGIVAWVVGTATAAAIALVAR